MIAWKQIEGYMYFYAIFFFFFQYNAIFFSKAFIYIFDKQQLVQHFHDH